MAGIGKNGSCRRNGRYRAMASIGENGRYRENDRYRGEWQV